MIVTHSKIMVCQDCLMLLANGDSSGADENSYDFEALAKFEIELHNDNMQIVVSSSEETDNEFSAQSCAACNSHLAGSRHQCTILQTVTLPISDDSAREAITGYQACAVWLATDDDGESVDHCELSDDSASELADDIINFLAGLPASLVLQYALATGDTWQFFGHDFFLTRNGHGAGFWDRGLGELGEKLSEHARAYGSRDLFFNDETNEIEVY